MASSIPIPSTPSNKSDSSSSSDSCSPSSETKNPYFDYAKEYYVNCRACETDKSDEEIQERWAIKSLPGEDWEIDDEDFIHNHDAIDLVEEESPNDPDDKWIKLRGNKSDLDDRSKSKLYDWMKTMNIAEVNLNHSPIRKLDSSLWDLMKNLKRLSLSGCKLRKVPKAIRRFTQLQDLNLSYNQLYAIPDWIGELGTLKKLNLSGNKLSTLPDAIVNLIALEELIIDTNSINELPDNFGNLVKLQVFEAMYNCLNQLPESFGSLIELRVAELCNNRLTNLPKSFSLLPNLEVIDLSENDLIELPETFASTSKLKNIYLDSNNIFSFPDWFCDLPNLVAISCKNNKLRGDPLPENFCTTSEQLRQVNFSGNLIEKLPDGLAKIQSLTYLEVGSPLLEPERRSDFKNGNRLKMLPELFGSLTMALIELRLDENDLERLPEGFGTGLQCLESLNLHQNNLTSLPDSFCCMKKLRRCILSYNQLKSLPNDIGNLHCLMELRLDYNKLYYLPHSIRDCVNLSTLDLYENEFDCFPSVLRKLPVLDCLGTGIHVSSMPINMNKYTSKGQVSRLYKATKNGLNRWNRCEESIKLVFKNDNYALFKSLKLDKSYQPCNKRTGHYTKLLEKYRNKRSRNAYDDDDEWDSFVDHDWSPSKLNKNKPKRVRYLDDIAFNQLYHMPRIPNNSVAKPILNINPLIINGTPFAYR